VLQRLGEIGIRLEDLAQKLEEEGIEKFNKLVDWGWFFFLTRPFFWVLDNLNKLLGNFGLAILGLTVMTLIGPSMLNLILVVVVVLLLPMELLIQQQHL